MQNAFTSIAAIVSIAISVALGQQSAIEPTDESLVNAKFRNSSLSIEERIDDLLPRLSNEEKVQLITGAHSRTIGAIPRIGLAECAFADDFPYVRTAHHDKAGAKRFPAAIIQAATWNPGLIKKLGEEMAEECKAAQLCAILGPNCNITRSPLEARSFEQYGEDPYLAGKMAAQYVSGVQSHGIAVCMKNWILSGQEEPADIDLGERAMKEIYMKPFEIAIKEASPWAMMAAGHALRGKYCAHNRALNDILYNEFQWDGALISTLGQDIEKALRGGCSLEISESVHDDNIKKLMQSIKENKISPGDLDIALRRTLRFLYRAGAFDRVGKEESPLPKQTGVERSIAEESIVLLKNENGILPIDPKSLAHIAIIDSNADWSQAGGDQHQNDKDEVTPFKALVDLLGKEKILYARGLGVDQSSNNSISGIKKMEPVEAAKQADIVLFFGDTNTKNGPKKDLSLSEHQANLIQKIVAANPRTIVVLTNGTPVQMEEWQADVPAIIEAWQGMQNTGHAIGRILIGEVNPSGKLPVTFGKTLPDWLSHSTGNRSYPGIETPDGTSKKIFFADYIWVGYRHFDKAGIEPRFSFGHGLSYTTFKIEKAQPPTPTVFTVKVTNTGTREGAEVVQFYLSKPGDRVPMPKKELVHFKKVHLQPGASEILHFTPTENDMRYWNEKEGKWDVEQGIYTMSVGHSSKNLPVVYTWLMDGRKIGYQ